MSFECRNRNKNTKLEAVARGKATPKIRTQGPKYGVFRRNESQIRCYKNLQRRGNQNPRKPEQGSKEGEDKEKSEDEKGHTDTEEDKEGNGIEITEDEREGDTETGEDEEDRMANVTYKKFGQKLELQH